MKFDLTSDLHVDFWLDYRSPVKKQQKLLGEFVRKLLPDEPSNVLVIAGDLGHFNQQNKLLLEALKVHYKAIVLVHGNHDLYLVSHAQAKKYDNNSFNRLNEMVDFANSITGAHYLQGESVKLDGINFAGSGLWYDNTYARQLYSMSDAQIDSMWVDFMNDSNLINAGTEQFDRYRMFNDEYNRLLPLISGSDVVVTHVAPTYDFIPVKYNNATSTFYQFDGSDMLLRLGDGKAWCYGHTHDRIMGIHRTETQLCCNPLGYPNEKNENWMSKGFPSKSKILNINIERVKSYEEIFGTNDESIS